LSTQTQFHKTGKPRTEAPRPRTSDPKELPGIDDLMARLHFAPSEGRIWLDDQRMQLIHTSAMGVLRRELIESLGIELARGLLTRMGYNSGVVDAELARKLRPGLDTSCFVAGPQLHALEGIVHVEVVKMEMDIERGKYYGEFIWRNSSEDEEHVRIYGIGAEPVCWMQIGYASGYTSEFMGRPVLFREVECRSTGNDHCRIVGKPVEEWDDAEEDVRYLQAETFTRGLSATARGSRSPLPDNAAMFADGDIVGVSTGFNAVCHMLRCVADTDATVLFLGESGVGKEVFARTLHRISERAKGAFIAVNCAAIPENLVEAELFGVEKGAYTGATASREGRFERANHGTLFLDEIGIMNLTAQGKLLRALQEGEIERVGDTQVRKVDVRVIAATNLDLKAEVHAGRFREDLYFRLNVFPVKVPPLRERREDIPVLMNHFLRKFCLRHKRQVTGFTARAIDALLSYELPGNIRELENMIERGVILARPGGAIDVGQLFASGEHWDTPTFGVRRDGHVSSPAPLDAACEGATQPVVREAIERIQSLISGDADVSGFSLDRIEGTLEAALLQSAISRAGGNLSAAARLLGISRSRLVYRLAHRGLPTPRAN
jgi:two-component system, NtrC family, response regulator HydG